MALESIEIEDTCMDGGEELVCQELDQGFPDKVAADRVEEATEETFRLTILKPETIETFTERSRLVPSRLQTEGVDLPSEKPRAASFCVDADSGA